MKVVHLVIFHSGGTSERISDNLVKYGIDSCDAYEF